MVRQNANGAPAVLNSWKEIASYLERGVRTVQRWERELHLPVHRIGKGKRSPVYADLTELKFWLSTTGAARQPNGIHPQQPSTPGRSPIEDSRRLLLMVRDLARQIAETSVRQRQQAEVLQARILEMRSKMR